MKSFTCAVIVLLGISLYGCVEKDDMCCTIPETSELSGTWLLYETGSSPGFGYITKAIPSKPPQTLTIDDSNISITLEGMESFRFYRILTDTATNPPSQYIALYARDPDVYKPSSDGPTYSFSLESNILTLRFRWCYEGCHMAFKKIK
jgi:hypothetical protein